MKICNRCQITKDLSEFSKASKNSKYLRGYCKDCARNYAKEYYKRNMAIVKIYNKSYRQLNRQRLKEAHKKWHQDNWESAKEYAQNYRTQNKEKCNTMTKTWRDKNKVKFSNLLHKRNKTLKANGVFEISAKDLKKLQVSNCFYCGQNENLSIDHIVPVSKGGRHSIGNLVRACQSCNSSKNNKFLYSWLVSK
jgi:hypothetical protein